jgi:serine/threonine protein kinase
MSIIREPNTEPIDGYRLIEPLGSGGFGEVWKCEAPGGLFKAIKFVYGNLNSLDVDSVRAEQELHALQRVKEVRHPFVCSLDLIKVVEGELVIVMELADKSLHDLYVECQSAGLVGIPRDNLLRYLRDAAEALDHMNEKYKLQHLDIKPRNLFLICDRVKVADFGLVKHLERQTPSGLLGGVTPLYAPPETFVGKISERSDQYSLAVVYQELLTGQRPFTGKNVRQLAQQHMQEEPDLRALPEGDRPVVARALAKDPAKRFPNCMAFVRALFTARSHQVRPEPHPEESAVGVQGLRPKSLHDTMEDFQLENPVVASLEVTPPPLPEEPEDSSHLGMTVAQPDTGALRPTVIVGIGGFGRRALLELRCRFLDRFGDLNKLPLLRFLYVDCDAEALLASVRGTPEVALSRSEVCHLPLQQIGHYRRSRRSLEHLCEWLPQEKLYAVPRSLQTQGSRALGRLAFADNHLRFLARIKREVQQAIHPDTLYQSVTQTGLALRDSVPRVYVVVAATGGNSGLLVDLGYALRRLLHTELRQPEAEATLLLFCGTPTDPATPGLEQANLYATLTELNHFTDPVVPFSAQYGAEGPCLRDSGQPYNCAYLLPMANRSPESLRDAVAHLGSYLFHELTTPLGLRLDRGRRLAPTSGQTFFRSFGTYSVWFPRGLLLRLAAKQACTRLFDDWMVAGEPTAAVEVEAACARTLADSDLRVEAIASRIEELSCSSAGPSRSRGSNGKSGERRAASDVWLEALPAEVLTGMLFTLEEQSQQSVAQDDPGNWARQALSRIREWTGSNTTSTAGSGGDWRKARLGRALSAAADKLAAEWNDRLVSVAWSLMEHPGRRVAAADAILGRFVHFAEEMAVAQETRLGQQKERTFQAWQQVEIALGSCLSGGGGFSFFGNRSRRVLRVFMDHLAAYARQRLIEELLRATQQFFALLRGRLDEQLRDLTFCRQRLRHLQECLETPPQEEEELAATRLGDTTLNQSPTPSTESFWDSIRQSATAHVVLPDGDEDLERSASRFLGTLTAEQWTNLDQVLQDSVLALLGGLYDACRRTSDLRRNLAVPLLDQATTFLGSLLPTTDVAQVERNTAAVHRIEVGAQAKDYFERGVPLLANKDLATQDPYLLIPASEEGKAFGAAAQAGVAGLQLVRVPGQAHLMFCREQGYLSPEDLQKLLRPCQRAYQEANTVVTVSPHARFDITDWVPIDP